MKKIIRLLPLLPTLLLLFTSPAAADMTFHTQRLTFALTPAGMMAGNPQLIAGQVVDIHPDGPVNGAIEQYMINGAKPNTAYQVKLRIFPSCTGVSLATTPQMTISTALLTTDNTGFAQGSFVFTSASLVPFNGLTFGVLWTLVSGPIVAYDTVCISVSVG